MKGELDMNMLNDRIAGALYGVAVGDALGGPLEFMSAEEINRRHGWVSTMLGGGWLNLRPGETTDDTAMTLAVAEGVMESPEAPFQAIGAQFIEWTKSGPKDIGGTCRSGIMEAIRIGGDRPEFRAWKEGSQRVAERNGHRSGGNGALMRAVYPALFYPDKDEAVRVTRGQGHMTHWDGNSDEACQIYALMVHCLITEAEKLEGDPERLRKRFDELLHPTKYNTDNLLSLGRSGGLEPSGYVVDSFKCALFCLWDSEGFADAICNAANMGGDADTIAAICGGLAGALYGFQAIPQEWVSALSAHDRERLDAATAAAVENQEKSMMC